MKVSGVEKLAKQPMEGPGRRGQSSEQGTKGGLVPTDRLGESPAEAPAGTIFIRRSGSGEWKNPQERVGEPEPPDPRDSGEEDYESTSSDSGKSKGDRRLQELREKARREDQPHVATQTDDRQDNKGNCHFVAGAEGVRAGSPVGGLVSARYNHWGQGRGGEIPSGEPGTASQDATVPSRQSDSNIIANSLTGVFLPDVENSAKKGDTESVDERQDSGEGGQKRTRPTEEACVQERAMKPTAKMTIHSESYESDSTADGENIDDSLYPSDRNWHLPILMEVDTSTKTTAAEKPETEPASPAEEIAHSRQEECEPNYSFIECEPTAEVEEAKLTNSTRRGRSKGPPTEATTKAPSAAPKQVDREELLTGTAKRPEEKGEGKTTAVEAVAPEAPSTRAPGKVIVSQEKRKTQILAILPNSLEEAVAAPSPFRGRESTLQVVIGGGLHSHEEPGSWRWDQPLMAETFERLREELPCAAHPGQKGCILTSQGKAKSTHRIRCHRDNEIRTWSMYDPTIAEYITSRWDFLTGENPELYSLYQRAYSTRPRERKSLVMRPERRQPYHVLSAEARADLLEGRIDVAAHESHRAQVVAYKQLAIEPHGEKTAEAQNYKQFWEMVSVLKDETKRRVKALSEEYLELKLMFSQAEQARKAVESPPSKQCRCEELEAKVARLESAMAVAAMAEADRMKTQDEQFQEIRREWEVERNLLKDKFEALNQINKSDLRGISREYRKERDRVAHILNSTNSKWQRVASLARDQEKSSLRKFEATESEISSLRDEMARIADLKCGRYPERESSTEQVNGEDATRSDESFTMDIEPLNENPWKLAITHNPYITSEEAQNLVSRAITEARLNSPAAPENPGKNEETLQNWIREEVRTAGLASAEEMKTLDSRMSIVDRDVQIVSKGVGSLISNLSMLTGAPNGQRDAEFHSRIEETAKAVKRLEGMPVARIGPTSWETERAQVHAAVKALQESRLEEPKVTTLMNPLRAGPASREPATKPEDPRLKELQNGQVTLTREVLALQEKCKEAESSSWATDSPKVKEALRKLRSRTDKVENEQKTTKNLQTIIDEKMQAYTSKATLNEIAVKALESRMSSLSKREMPPATPNAKTVETRPQMAEAMTEAETTTPAKISEKPQLWAQVAKGTTIREPGQQEQSQTNATAEAAKAAVPVGLIVPVEATNLPEATDKSLAPVRTGAVMSAVLVEEGVHKEEVEAPFTLVQRRKRRPAKASDPIAQSAAVPKGAPQIMGPANEPTAAKPRTTTRGEMDPSFLMLFQQLLEKTTAGSEKTAALALEREERLKAEHTAKIAELKREAEAAQKKQKRDGARRKATSSTPSKETGRRLALGLPEFDTTVVEIPTLKFRSYAQAAKIFAALGVPQADVLGVFPGSVCGSVLLVPAGRAGAVRNGLAEAGVVPTVTGQSQLENILATGSPQQLQSELTRLQRLAKDCPAHKRESVETLREWVALIKATLGARAPLINLQDE